MPDRAAQRLGAEPPGSCDSEIKRKLKRIKGDSVFTKALDSLVVSSDLLGGDCGLDNVNTSIRIFQ